MTTLLYTHPACLEHDPGRHHPESAARLHAVLNALADPEFARLERREAPEAALDDLIRVHPRQHVERMLRTVPRSRSEEHTSELQSRVDLVCRLLLETK